MEQGKKNIDRTLLIVVILLLGVGLIVLFSTSSYNGRVRFGDEAYYLKKQAFATILGLAVFYLVANIDYHVVVRFAVWFYFLSVLLGIAVLIFGDAYNGSKRWLSIGPLSFQPSEFAKAAVIIFLAWMIDRSKDNMSSMKFMVKVMITILPIVGLVGTNNLSTAIIILGIGVILIFIANPKYVQFLGIGGIGIVFIVVFLTMESYRLERLAVWRDPESYEKGFQTIQGLYAIGSGGIFGRGIGSSIQKLGFVPEAQNDMIFSIICEETGLVGAWGLMLLFGLLIWRLMVIATHAPDLCGAMIGAGVMGHIALQVILNIAVVTNTIPNTGITLPFVSYGGTSILFLLGELGLALSVSRYEKQELL